MTKSIYSDLSGRHTRLRYQSVTFALLTFLAGFFGIADLNFPVIFSLEKVPNDIWIFFGVFFLALYSLIGFIFQNNVEEAAEPNFIRDFIDITRQLQSSLYSGRKPSPFNDENECLYNTMNKCGKILDRVDKSQIGFEDLSSYHAVVTTIAVSNKPERLLHQFIDAKGEMLKISPGHFSRGQRVYQRLEALNNTFKNLVQNLDIFCKEFKSLDKEDEDELVTQIDLDMFSIQSEAQSIDSELGEFTLHLIKLKRSIAFHRRVFPFLIPKWLSVLMIFLGAMGFAWNKIV